MEPKRPKQDKGWNITAVARTSVGEVRVWSKFARNPPRILSALSGIDHEQGYPIHRVTMHVLHPGADRTVAPDDADTRAILDDFDFLASEEQEWQASHVDPLAQGGRCFYAPIGGARA